MGFQSGIYYDDRVKMLEILTFNEGKEKFNFIRKNKKRINANISYMYAFFTGRNLRAIIPAYGFWFNKSRIS